ncbi:MAG: type I methionyl aminopeptidase [Candidatus Levybacteria bacterium RBG_16_35_11]|nr:MAG: type I methionyl aminopeptidase [Candidatus Levybacteria bacterium RBG_16_35_11]
MIKIKSPEDLRKMQEGGKILAQILAIVSEGVKPGVSEKELEEIANLEIKKRGGYPSFKKVRGYKNALCLSINDTVVHGIPGNYRFKEGDIVGIDCGVFYKGFNTDMAETVSVGSTNNEIYKFLETGRKALSEAIGQARIGNRVGNISQKIQEIIERAGYSVVRTLVGHGIGKDLHEEPEVPGFLQGRIEDTSLLKAGMTLAIEVIYNMGKSDVKYDKDGWTIRTKDGQISGLFERTIAVTKSEPLILTR